MSAKDSGNLSHEHSDMVHNFLVSYHHGHPTEHLAAQLIDILGKVPADNVGMVQRVFRYPYIDYGKPRETSSLMRLVWSRGRSVAETPFEGSICWLMIFNGNGFIRESALKNINDPPPSPLFLAGLLLRLNDHVAQVRAAAEQCLDRIEDRIASETLCAILPYYFRHRIFWDEFAFDRRIIALAERPEAKACLLRQLRDSQEGRMPAFFRSLLANDLVDDFLPALAIEAFHPAVRAQSAKALFSGEVGGLPGFESIVVSERLGVTRKVFSNNLRRTCIVEFDLDTMLRATARDRSSKVRKEAAQGLIGNLQRLADVEAYLELFAAEENPRVKDRIDYVRRQIPCNVESER